MQLLELSHMLDGATTPHLLLPGVAIPGRDCQGQGDDGCLRASVHMPGLQSHHFQAALDGWDAPKCTCADGISGLYYLGSSPPCFCGFVDVEVLILLLYCYIFIVLHYSLVPFAPLKFASRD